jgi:TatD DNase family protein
VGSIKLSERYAVLVFAAVGVHPWNVQTISDEEVEAVVKLAEENRNNKALVAIGEVGLDSKYIQVWERQLKVFDTMLRLAERLDLPVCVHSRGAVEQVVDLLPSYRVKRVLLHWFSGSLSVLDRAVDRGYYVSEGPAVVYSSVIRDIVRRVPLTNLLTETDGPTRYHKPPFNAKTTTPATHIPTVATTIADVKERKWTEIGEQTSVNLGAFLVK